MQQYGLSSKPPMTHKCVCKYSHNNAPDLMVQVWTPGRKGLSRPLEPVHISIPKQQIQRTPPRLSPIPQPELRRTLQRGHISEHVLVPPLSTLGWWGCHCTWERYGLLFAESLTSEDCIWSFPFLVARAGYFVEIEVWELAVETV